ncbi:MAG TPA: beta-galactosidase [Acidimicrobiales bacterium]|nr:beta-galactosidase [Acidimicrobiales bacterium]
MIIASQYYRPPFPDRKRWVDDLPAMRAAGLDAVYLWVCWGWVEPEPGRFVFDDYDELIELAGRAGLKVVLNTIAEIQPFWIHREVPGSELVDHLGNKVVSGLRRECNVGLTPGGCTDHPMVRDLMGRFLAETGSRYSPVEHLVAWDLWNETRWAVESDGYVCRCEHTLTAFRGWLAARYGDLDGLNAAWKRRYASFEDVYPGRLAGRTYTEMTEFEAFLTDRAHEHMAFRYEIVRSADPGRLIVAHAALPAPYAPGFYRLEHALSRGNDWAYTDFLDGFGASVFPAWPGWSDGAVASIGARLECSRSAAQNKTFWVGELQGGAARGGLEVQQSVSGEMQQRWLWSAIGRGAKAVNFWCWRDEVFGRESSGFGIVGNDGFAAERLAGLRATSALIATHRVLLDAYRPDPAQIGVLFSQPAYQLDWAETGPDNRIVRRSLQGYLHALERLQLAYEVIESRHTRALGACRLLVMPAPLVVEEALAAELLAWVREGGTLLVESELDAYTALGFYRYPDERPFAAGLGVRSLGRRTIDDATFEFELSSSRGQIPLSVWAEPFDTSAGAVRGTSDHGPLLVEISVGAGTVLALGTFAGLGYQEGDRRDFEPFLAAVANTADVVPLVSCGVGDGEVVHFRSGTAGDRRLLFVTNERAPRELSFTLRGDARPKDAVVEDIVAGATWRVESCDHETTITGPVAAHTVLAWEAPGG